MTLDFLKNLSVIKKVSFNMGRSMLVARKYSPDVLTYAGVVGVIGATVLACHATTNLRPIIVEAHDKLEDKHDLNLEIEAESGQTQADRIEHARNVAAIYAQTAVQIAKLYAAPAILGSASIGCILGSHGIMKRRNAGLIAAYKALDEGFKRYRSRVVQEYGAEADKMYAGGIHEDSFVNEEGEKNHKRKVISFDEDGMPSPYARFFDEYSTYWSKSPEINLMTIRCAQNHANEKLRANGHVFLNEVYDSLGIPRSQAGALCGWVLNSRNGDQVIDFGLYDLKSNAAREFVNGYERSILLDFNVDGPIYDLI